MRRNPAAGPGTSRKTLFALLTLAALATTGLPASARAAQTPAPTPAATARLVTQVDLAAAGAQMRQKITAQADQLAAIRQQLGALKAQMQTLQRQVNGVKVPGGPVSGRP